MTTGIPITYVPARNTIFLAFALAWAEVLGANDVFIGVNALDYSGYPDCRPEFIAAFEGMANLATKAGVEGQQRCRSALPSSQCQKPRLSARDSRWAWITRSRAVAMIPRQQDRPAGCAIRACCE
jgi:7-cyano-7-deazaguanine synthase